MQGEDHDMEADLLSLQEITKMPFFVTKMWCGTKHCVCLSDDQQVLYGWGEHLFC